MRQMNTLPVAGPPVEKDGVGVTAMDLEKKDVAGVTFGWLTETDSVGVTFVDLERTGPVGVAVGSTAEKRLRRR